MNRAIPLELTGLAKVFPGPAGPVTAVTDVNARIHAGEFVAILGHSGCGKSTVLSIIAGLEKATFGGVVIDGTQVIGPGADRALVFQAPCLLPWLTASQNVRLAINRRAARAAETTLPPPEHYLDLVGVGDAANQLPGELSLGT